MTVVKPGDIDGKVILFPKLIMNVHFMHTSVLFDCIVASRWVEPGKSYLTKIACYHTLSCDVYVIMIFIMLGVHHKAHAK